MKLKVSNEFGEEVLELTRKATTRRFIGNQLVSAKPCWLLSVCMEPTDPDAVSEVKLLNGETDRAECLLYLKSRYAHVDHNGAFPKYFNRGMFSVCVTGADGCTIQFLEDSP